ncbi:MAG: hydrogenase maturation nickel metallochaperone HypA, partial [Bacteroidales bacterium]|nr:hydrogenase maturation nickel metallochaperone HypA [Bacteroidales bacterium]
LEALEAGMHLAMKNSLMDNAEMVINRVKTKLQCSDCKYTFNPGCDDTIFMPCPRCGFFTSVIEGKEFKINSIDIK